MARSHFPLAAHGPRRSQREVGDIQSSDEKNRPIAHPQLADKGFSFDSAGVSMFLVGVLTSVWESAWGSGFLESGKRLEILFFKAF